MVAQWYIHKNYMRINRQQSKKVLAYIITPQARPLDFLITDIHKLHLRKTFEMVDTKSNIQLYDLNSKPHGGKSLLDIIYWVIGVHLYPPPGLENYKLHLLDRFHGSTHINDNHSNNDNKKIAQFV